MSSESQLALTLVIGVTGALITTLLSIVAYFLRRGQDALDTRLTKLETADASAKDKADATKESILARIDAVRSECNARLDGLKADLETMRRSSIVDDGARVEKLRAEFTSAISKLYEELRSLRDDVHAWQNQATEKFLPKVDFARDNTMLDSKISGVYRTIKSVESSVDTLLKSYVERK